eukprot:scaffold143892_cov25-Tisochrysis_lutea.AAC.1
MRGQHSTRPARTHLIQRGVRDIVSVHYAHDQLERAPPVPAAVVPVEVLWLLEDAQVVCDLLLNTGALAARVSAPPECPLGGVTKRQNGSAH